MRRMFRIRFAKQSEAKTAASAPRPLLRKINEIIHRDQSDQMFKKGDRRSVPVCLQRASSVQAVQGLWCRLVSVRLSQAHSSYAWLPIRSSDSKQIQSYFDILDRTTVLAPISSSLRETETIKLSARQGLNGVPCSPTFRAYRVDSVCRNYKVNVCYAYVLWR